MQLQKHVSQTHESPDSNSNVVWGNKHLYMSVTATNMSPRPGSVVVERSPGMREVGG